MSSAQKISENEALPIIEYITTEMNINACGEDAVKMRELNSYSAKKMIEEWDNMPFWKQLLMADMPRIYIESETTKHQLALIMWTINVFQGAKWDHKEHIRTTFNPRNPQGEQVWHRLGKNEYYYDIWSNIHYGFVANACGFKLNMMLEGAGLEQIGSDLLRKKWPQGQGNVEGLKKFDDPSDQRAITLGFNLYTTAKARATVDQVKAMVLGDTKLAQRPFIAK